MSQGPGQPVYQQPYPYQAAPPPPQGYYAAPSHQQQQYQQQQQQPTYGQLPPPSSSFQPQPQPPSPQQQGWIYPQQQQPLPPQAGYGYAAPPPVASAGYQPYYGQQPPPTQAQMVGGRPPQQQQQGFVPGVPHPAQVPTQPYPYPNPHPQQQPGYGPPPSQPWQPSSSQPTFGQPPPPPPSFQHPPFPPLTSTGPSPYAALSPSTGRPPPLQPGSPLSISNSVRYSASNPPRSSYPVAAPPLQLAQPQPQPLVSPLPTIAPSAPPPGKYPSQIPSALSPLPSATISPLNRGPPLSSPHTFTPPTPRPATSTTSSFSSVSSSSTTPASSSRPLPPPHSSLASSSSRRLPPLATTGIRPGSSYDGIGSPATALSPSMSSRPPLPTTPGGSSAAAGGRPLPSPATRDRSGSSPVVTASRPLPPSSSSASSTDLNRSDTVSSVKSLDLNGGRPLPRPPGGVANSKSLDRGVGEGGARGFGTAAGSRVDIGASDSLESLPGGASGIARATTLPSGAPQAAYSTPTRRGSDLPTLPSLPQPPRTTIPIIPTSPSAPILPTIPSISTTSIPTINAPSIVEPSPPSPSSASPSTPVRSQPPPPEIIIRTSPSPSQKIPVITEPSSSSPTKSGPPPFIVPIFNFPSGDDGEEDDHSNHHHHSREPSAPQITLSASPKANDKTPLPPLPPAKVSTASEQSTTKKRGGVVCEGCGDVILGKLIAGSAGMVWHPKCYKCTTCGLQLEHVSPYEQEGKLYCHFDYHELFTTRCYTCKTPIVDERFFTVNSPSAPTLPRYYHELHFFCSECGDPFLDPLRSTAAGGTGRDEEEDQGVEEEMKIHWWKDHPFCEKCDVKLHNPKCAKCRLALEGEYLEALGGMWHPGCLVCDSCEKEFENGRIFQWEEVPLCEPCFELIRRDDL